MKHSPGLWSPIPANHPDPSDLEGPAPAFLLLAHPTPTAHPGPNSLPLTFLLLGCRVLGHHPQEAFLSQPVYNSTRPPHTPPAQFYSPLAYWVLTCDWSAPSPVSSVRNLDCAHLRSLSPEGNTPAQPHILHRTECTNEGICKEVQPVGFLCYPSVLFHRTWREAPPRGCFGH